MRLGWAKTKYSISYYAKKTIYVDGKNKDLVIKRFGSEKQICEKYGVTDAKAWAKEQVRLMNEAEKEDSVKFNIELCSGTDLVMNEQRRFNGGYLFSYSPVEGNDKVFNASLLGSKLLAMCYKYIGNEEFKNAAQQSIVACASAQQDNGAWLYGMLNVQQWVDSFHTGYNLDAMIAYQDCTGDSTFNKYIERGFDYYIKNFFEQPGQLFVTLARLGRFSQHEELATKVHDWTIKNMQSPQGYFYYQLKQGISSKISYMRWSNAFMLNALSYLLLAKLSNNKVI